MVGLRVLFFSFVVLCCACQSSVPYPTYFNTLDQRSVDFIRGVPAIDLNDYAPQSKRRPSVQIMKERDIVVSVSGGGARAAAFSLGILAEMENINAWRQSNEQVNALAEVDYFSTVSGGGWGVSAYLSDAVHTGAKDYSLNSRLVGIKDKFLKFSDEGRDCLAKGIDKYITHGVNFDVINVGKGEVPLYPYFFVNATVEANQSPFVFVGEHIEHYQISRFYACDDDVVYSVAKSGRKLPISYAVATSGSVPGFYSSSATTNICQDENLYKSAFCSQGKRSDNELTLVDGGVYDNYGVFSALEILGALPQEREKALIVIDSNADTEIPFQGGRDRWEMSIGRSTLLKAGFPGKTTFFNRMMDMIVQKMNSGYVVLDFYSAALDRETLKKVDALKMLDGLDVLREHALKHTKCFAGDGRYLEDADDRELYWSEDCDLNNFYRSGLVGKTTYMFDEYYFTLLEQLGRFVVRVNADEIFKVVYQ